MIKSLTVQNIQSHKDTFLEFDKGVNCIIGPSNKGKSAIFNAIYKIIYNRPLGDQWRSWWGGTSLIGLELEEHLITYMKDKTASYTVGNIDGQVVFNAFGSDVPQEVTQLLNIDRKINIQQQLERTAPIFLISESPGEVAKFFNRVAGLYKIDETIKKGKQDLTKTEKGFNITKDLITEKNEELKLYDGIEGLAKKVIKCKILEDRVHLSTKKEINLNLLLSKIKPLKDGIGEKNKRLKTKTKVNKAINILNEYQTTNDRIQLLDNKLFNISDLKESIQTQTKRIKVLPKINKALPLIKKLNVLIAKKSLLIRLKTAIGDANHKIEYLSTKYKQTALKYDKIKPSVCPICGGKWND